MTESDIGLNISKLKTVKIKVIANASISFLAQHIEKAIKHPDFFDIDYDKFGKDIIDKSNISPNEKDQIHKMFKNLPQKNSSSSNCNPPINKIDINQLPEIQKKIAETQKNVDTNKDININSNNCQTNNNSNNSKSKNKLSFSHCFYYMIIDNENNNSNSEDNDSDTEYMETEFIDIEDFEIQEKIYKRDYFSIFKIFEKNTNKIYAAKRARFNIRRYVRNIILDFAHEVNTSLKLIHPSIIECIGYSSKSFKNKDKQVIVYEYAPNKSLDLLFNSIRNNKKIAEWNDSKRLINIYGIASAMSFLHSNKMIHCNLQPNNILLDEHYYPKISDFKSSKKITRDDEMNDSFLRCAPEYTAPEVYFGLNYSKASDVYSFAYIIYELMTNEKPFNDISDGLEIMKSACQKKIRPEFKKQIDENYRQLIEKCWSDNSNDRPTFSEILIQLETNEKFITKNVDKNEYYQYIDYIKKSEQKFYSTKHINELDNILQFNTKYFDANKISGDTEDFTFEPFNIEEDLIDEYNGILKKINSNQYNYDESDDEDDNCKVINTEDIKLNLKDISRSEVINFCNTKNVLIKINHLLLGKYANNKTISLFNIDYYAKSYKERYDYRYKYIEMWDMTCKLNLLYGIAAGMEYLHSHNIIHRDLKSFNVITTCYTTPQIRGFDLAILMDRRDKKIIMDEIKGTPAYLAPEVYLKKEYSEKSDVYSYALLMYEILTEMKPFDEYSNAIEIKEIICDKQQRPEFKQPINVTYRQLIERCWSQNPDDRPTFSEILTELETNKKLITSNIDKKEYQDYINLIKNAKSTFKSSNKIENIDKYINFNLVRHVKFDNNIISKGVFQTETNSICFNRYYKNINNFLQKRFIAEEEYHKSYEFLDKEKNISYLGRVGKQKIFNSNKLLFNFAKEIEIYSKLKHPVLSQFEGFSMYDNKGDPCQIIFSQYASNNTLYHIIEAENEGYQIKEYDDTKRLITIYGIASAMKLIHEHKIIFRNLKPENILLDEYLHPKLEFVFQYLYDYDSHYDEKVNVYLDPSIEYNNYTESSDVCTFALIMYEIIMKKKINLFVKTEEDIKKMLSYGERPMFDKNYPPQAYQDLLENCWAEEASDRLTFSEIVDRLKTDSGLITSAINKEEYYKYIQFIEENKTNLEKEFTKYKIEFPNVIKKSKFLVGLDPLDLSKYEKDTQIGKGGFGSVYKVTDKNTGEIFAAKVSIYELEECDYESVQNLSREVEIISQLNHPSILKYIGYSPVNFKAKSKPTIITEFAHNGSLDIIIDLERKGLAMDDWDDTKKLINIYGIAAGMKYLHDRNIIHRDLKPANIFMDEFLYPKIGDFGLSRDYESGHVVINISALSEKENPVNLSEENISHEDSGFKGTFAYSAPEILKKSKYSEKGDVFAFGMIVYEIVTNEILYKDMNRYDILKKISNGYRHEFKFPIPYSYKRLIQKCWSQDPDDRPQFRDIVFNLENDPGFITENVDKEDYLNYIYYVKQTNYNPTIKSSQEKIVNKTSNNTNPNLIKVIENESNSTENMFLNLNQYQKVADISKGDFYKISKVQEIKNKTIFAAKESIIKTSKLSKNESIEFSNEIQIISKINYPSLLKFIGYSPVNFKKESKPVFITEITANGSLDQVLKAKT